MIKKILYGSSGLGVLSLGGYYFLKINFMKNMINKDTVYKFQYIDNRNNMIKKLESNHYDILIIGGGATGSGIALDCATRGIKCALIDKNDFSSGTSSKSTKLLHGGIRYLENAVKNLDLKELYFVWEALSERAHTMKIAPYMSKPVSILMPIYKYWEIPYFAFNIKIYDLLSDLVCCFDKGIPNSSYSRKSNTINDYPLLKKNKLKGSLVYYDGQHNDSRMNLNLVLTSAIDNYVPGQVGATICNYMEVISFIKDDNHKIIGVKALDTINNKEIEIYAKIIINAAGPYADIIRKIADENCKSIMKLSMGCHLILPKWYSYQNNGIIIPKTSDDRVIFLLPWENYTIVGTTDEEKNIEDNPKINKKEIDFMANELSNFIEVSSKEIKADIKAAWCGFRPLVFDLKKKSDKDSSTHSILRNHEIIEDNNGLINILGGKWTIYRKMAQDTIDYILSNHNDKIKSKYNCRTKFLMLIGCHDDNGVSKINDMNWGCSKLSKQLVQKYSELDPETANHLVSSYGYISIKICKLAKELNLFNKIHHTKPYIEAEVIYAIRNEFAVKISDIICRRLRLGFVDSKISNDVINKVSHLLKEELHWTDDQMNLHINESKQYISSLSSE